ncbi:meiotic recombination protein SPO11 [Rhineura floridana]|uniref:meiotic recombination protein SPO11 n=1 Tax=Rhineura floridana TaxID=261503 RepID=UPI002AC811CB|nr:meiotic recombination protein SPO11 [Rhineura floridana]
MLTDSERNYTVWGKQLLAIRDAFEAWRHHLEGAQHEIEVRTDHRNLESLHTSSAEDLLQELHAMQQLLQEQLERAKADYKCTADQHRQEGAPIQVGDKLWVSTRYFPMLGRCRKLQDRHVGPFEVEAQISPVAYRLRLPPTFKMHPVFHWALLTKDVPPNPHFPRVEPTPPLLVVGEMEYEEQGGEKHEFQAPQLPEGTEDQGVVESARDLKGVSELEFQPVPTGDVSSVEKRALLPVAPEGSSGDAPEVVPAPPLPSSSQDASSVTPPPDLEPAVQEQVSSDEPLEMRAPLPRARHQEKRTGFTMTFPRETNWSLFTLLDKHRLSLREAAGVTLGSRHDPFVACHSCEISSSDVLKAIEKVVEGVITSLSRNEAPVLILNNRSNWGNILFKDSVGLQMTSNCTTRKIRSDCPKSAPKFALFLKMLSIIYKMVQTNIYATKRDIFYTDTVHFGNQRVVDNIVNDISCMLKIPRRSLHILSTSKGCIAGNLSYIEEDGTKVNCTCSTTAAVPSNVEGMKNLITEAKFILIIEKDATFQRLLDDDFCSKMSPCIIMTGKGVPDVNTRLLVRKLWDTCHVPIFALMDGDPHGIEIMCIYKYGSVSMSFEAHRLTVPAIRWLGLLPSDFARLSIPKNALIPLTKQDQSKLASLQTRPYIAYQSTWKKELDIMATSKMKAEIQALTSFSSDYLSRVYLPNKLQFGGWI